MTSCGCTSALTRRSGSSASTAVSELQPPRPATWAPSSTCEPRRGSGVDASRDRASAPAAPLLQGFWLSCAADHPHTRSEIKPRVCGWSVAQESQTRQRRSGGSRRDEKTRQMEEEQQQDQRHRRREAAEQREQQQQQHAAMGPVGQREERDRGRANAVRGGGSQDGDGERTAGRDKRTSARQAERSEGRRRRSPERERAGLLRRGDGGVRADSPVDLLRRDRLSAAISA
jgi:hypothetical protein